MSEPTKTPLTMTAEREAELRVVPLRSVMPKMRNDLIVEIDATREALNSAQRRISALYALGEDLKQQLDKAREELAAARALLEPEDDPTEKPLSELVDQTLTDLAWYVKEHDKLREANAWQPIETAPKDDAKKLLIWVDGELGIWYRDLYYTAGIGRGCLEGMSGWVDQEGCARYDSPTHWRPLPDPPEAK